MTRIANAENTYNTAMNGTSLDVVLAMLLIPPTTTRATQAAMTTPRIHARPKKTLSPPPVTSITMAAA